MGSCHSGEESVIKSGVEMPLNICYCKWCKKNTMGSFEGMVKWNSGGYMVFNKCYECHYLIRNVRLL
jgi:hypothetical protein